LSWSVWLVFEIFDITVAMVTAVAGKPVKNGLWSCVEGVVWCRGGRGLSSVRGFDFKRCTPGPKAIPSK